MLTGDHRRSRRWPLARAVAARVGPVGSAAAASPTRCEPQPSHPHGDHQAGFMLVEVIISALLVAMIVVATFNGFDSANRLTVDQRRHSEAAIIASESQEQLRSDSATALDALETASRSYTVERSGTKFNVTQEAKPLSPTGSGGCSLEGEGEAGANIQITTTVSWAALGKRPTVKQSGLISPPVGSALEVDVSNEGTPRVPSAGVTAIAKFTPTGSSTLASAEGTTGPDGCIVLSGLATTLAEVEIQKKPNFVTMEDHLKYPGPKEVSIAPNVTTHYEVAYAEGGRIQAQFTYNGSTEYEGQPVKGNTFVALNESIPEGANWQTGAQEFTEKTSGEEAQYEAVTTTASTTAETAALPGYTNGDLFPFATAWSVNAGDCPKNGTYPGAASSSSPVVKSGAVTTAEVPLSIVKLTVYSGTNNSSAIESTPAAAFFTNNECEGYELPDNAYAASLVHEQKTTTAGHLAVPFQPFGKETLCLVDTAAKRHYKSTFTNSTVAGTEREVYFGVPTKTEREASEGTAKTTVENDITTLESARKTRESEESAQKTIKTSRESTEKKERETWLSEEKRKSKPITKAQREAKEATQKKNREAAEAAEKPKWEKWAKEATEYTEKKTQYTNELSALNAAQAKHAEEEKAIEEKTHFTVEAGTTC
jgi:type II secretory pathway pseudopilin PulG